jgi:hypothetical protein
VKELYEALYPLVRDPKAKEALIGPYAKLIFHEYYRTNRCYVPWEPHRTEWMKKARMILEGYDVTN